MLKESADDEMKGRVVGVIGGGAAGLAAARHAAARGCAVKVWEQTASIGGTWVYTPHTGSDQHGLPIHSSMYQQLR